MADDSEQPDVAPDQGSDSTPDSAENDSPDHDDVEGQLPAPSAPTAAPPRRRQLAPPGSSIR